MQDEVDAFWTGVDGGNGWNGFDLIDKQGNAHDCKF